MPPVGADHLAHTHTMVEQIRPAQLAQWQSRARSGAHGDVGADAHTDARANSRTDAVTDARSAAPGDVLTEPLILDVREPHELETARVTTPGFRVLEIPMGDIPQRLQELHPETPVACLCHHGMRSNRVALYLQSQGFAHVVNIAGGIDAWSNELDASIAQY